MVPAGKGAFEVVALAASAGGLKAISEVLEGLPADFPAAIVVVQHVDSADLLFESVAASYRDRAIAVVLSGTGMDGSMGVEAVKKMGGTVIAEDEQSSEFFGMPQAAIQTGFVDFVLPLSEISSALKSLVASGEGA